METSEYKENEFKEELRKYIESELKNKLSDDDPFNLLNQQYYYHSQKWCEEKLKEIKIKLQDGRYPLTVYTKMIICVDCLIELGFPDSYMKDIKDLMVQNIIEMETLIILDNDVFFIENKQRKQRIKNIIDEMNLLIITKDKQIKQKTIEEIITNDGWVESLDKYTESYSYNSFMDISIFSKAESTQWIQAIMKASVEDIDLFRHWLDRHFPSNVIRENVKIDLPVIKEIMDGIRAEDENDLIKKANLIWLKKQLGEILRLYGEIRG